MTGLSLLSTRRASCDPGCSHPASFAMAGRLQQAGVSRAVYFLVLVPAGSPFSPALPRALPLALSSHL
jgi:hypothetical protein